MCHIWSGIQFTRVTSQVVHCCFNYIKLLSTTFCTSSFYFDIGFILYKPYCVHMILLIQCLSLATEHEYTHYVNFMFELKVTCFNICFYYAEITRIVCKVHRCPAHLEFSPCCVFFLLHILNGHVKHATVEQQTNFIFSQ